MSKGLVPARGGDPVVVIDECHELQSRPRARG